MNLTEWKNRLAEEKRRYQERESVLETGATRPAFCMECFERRNG